MKRRPLSCAMPWSALVIVSLCLCGCATSSQQRPELVSVAPLVPALETLSLRLTLELQPPPCPPPPVWVRGGSAVRSSCVRSPYVRIHAHLEHHAQIRQAVSARVVCRRPKVPGRQVTDFELDRRAKRTLALRFGFWGPVAYRIQCRLELPNARKWARRPQGFDAPPELRSPAVGPWISLVVPASVRK